MNPELLTRLDAIATKLGIAAAHLWDILVRQVYVEAVTDGVMFVVYAAVWAYAFRRARRNWNDSNIDTETAWLLGLGIGGLIVFLAGLFAFSETVTAILNPEAGALKILGRLLKGE